MTSSGKKQKVSTCGRSGAVGERYYFPLGRLPLTNAPEVARPASRRPGVEAGRPPYYCPLARPPGPGEASRASRKARRYCPLTTQANGRR